MGGNHHHHHHDGHDHGASDHGAHDHGADCGTCNRWSHMGRRRFMEALGVGLAAWTVAACSPDDAADTARVKGATTEAPTTSTTAVPTTTAPKVVDLDVFPEPRPGKPTTIFEAPTVKGQAPPKQIALTIDDGYCAECVDAYVKFAADTGMHITFSPNGTYQQFWNPHAETLRPLIERGQVQIANHTYNHLDLKKMADKKIEEELERNEEWVRATFGITTRPWYRPPFGFHNANTDGVAGVLGYTNVLMWNGSFGDANLLTPQVLMGEALKWSKPGTIMLGHANHPTAIELLPLIRGMWMDRDLVPVTLDEMFGTSRRTG